MVYLDIQFISILTKSLEQYKIFLIACTLKNEFIDKLDALTSNFNVLLHSYLDKADLTKDYFEVLYLLDDFDLTVDEQEILDMLEE